MPKPGKKIDKQVILLRHDTPKDSDGLYIMPPKTVLEGAFATQGRRGEVTFYGTTSAEDLREEILSCFTRFGEFDFDVLEVSCHSWSLPVD